MPLSDDNAALAAATLTSAIVHAGGLPPAGINKDETVGQVMDLYRRSLNVVRNAADSPRGKK